MFNLFVGDPYLFSDRFTAMTIETIFPRILQVHFNDGFHVWGQHLSLIHISEPTRQ